MYVMRKLCTIICLVLLSTGAALAEFDLGLKAGYTSSIGFGNISSVGDHTWKDMKADMSNGFHAGMFMRIGMAWDGRFYLQPEVLYNMEKREFDLMGELTNGTQFDISKYVTASTVDVPLLLGLKFLDLKIVNFRLLAGPKLRFNAGSKAEFGEGFDQYFTSVQEQFRKVTVGLEAGIGVELFNKVGVDVRYNLINQISKSTDWGNAISIGYDDPLNGFVVSVAFNLL